MTSSDSDIVTIEEQIENDKSKDKKVLINFKKEFVFCTDFEAFITFLAYHCNYENEDLQIDMGLDGVILVLEF